GPDDRPHPRARRSHPPQTSQAVPIAVSELETRHEQVGPMLLDERERDAAARRTPDDFETHALLHQPVERVEKQWMAVEDDRAPIPPCVHRKGRPSIDCSEPPSERTPAACA